MGARWWVRPDVSNRSECTVRSLFPRLLPLAACAAITLVSLAPVAHAQSALPDALVTNPTPSTAQIQQIEDHAAEMAAFIAVGERGEVERARKAMVRQFTGSQPPSSTFRRRYGRVLASELAGVVDRDDVYRSANALLALAPLRIDETLDVQIAALEDDLAGVRLAAAASLGDAIQGDTRGANDLLIAERALQAGAVALEGEQDPAVCAALVSSMSVQRQGNQQLLAKAAQALASTIPSVIANIDEDDHEHVLLWSQALGKSALTMRDGVQGSTDMSAVRRVTRGSAACIAFAQSILERQDDLDAFEDTPEGVALTDLVTAANAQIKRAESQLEAQPTNVDFGRALDRSFDNGDPGEFSRAISDARPAFDAMGVGADAFDPQP